ncbi:AraC family transcriptional regulator [Streptomyces sp. NPDC051211]|uniref:AraC family transcriptional regulator n=1 Tax=Streptomyces sp. NPDC051211 TaxID=3154643 RepID=UPI003450DEB5
MSGIDGETDLRRSGPADGSLLFRGGDVEVLHELISTRFAPNRMNVLHAHRLDGLFRCTHDGPVGLYELGYGAEVDVMPGAPLDFYNVHIPLAGDGAVTVDGKELPSALSIVGPGHEVSMRWNEKSRNRILIIPREVVDEAVSARLGGPPDSPLVFDPVFDARTAPTRVWLGLVERFAEFADAGLPALSPLALAHFEQLLVNGLLDVQPHALGSAVAGVGSGGGGGSAAVLRAVHRAREFCAEHAHEPIGASDMARAAGVAVRTLREGFRRHLDTTPLAYLRTVRLGLVRRDLSAVAEGLERGNVTEVALRWGFTHSGRFTAYYRQAYGETPSQTLRRKDCRSA